MDTPEKRTDAPKDRERTSDPLDDLEIPADLKQEIDEVDDTEILNQLIRDISPDLLDPENDLKPDEAGASTSAEMPKSQEVEEEAGTEEEHKAEDQVGSWLFDESFEEDISEIESPQPETEPSAEDKPVSDSSSESWLFDDSAIDLSTESSKEQAEAAAEQETGAQSIDDAFAAFGLEEEPIEAPASATGEEVVADTESSSDKEPASIAQRSNEPDAIIAALSSSIALRYVSRLEASIAGPGIKETTEEEAVVDEFDRDREEPSDEEPALTADIEDDFVVVDEEPSSSEELVESEESISDIDKILTEDFETEEDDDQEEEPSIDDLITSVVDDADEEELVPEASEEAADEDSGELAEEAEDRAEDTEVIAAPVTSQQDDDELDRLINEMKQRQKRRRIITGSVAAVVVLFVVYLIMRPSPQDDVHIAAAPPEVQERIEQQAMDDHVVDEAPLAEVPAPPPPITPQPVQPPPVQERPVTRAETVTPPPSTPAGAFTVHASSYRTMSSAEAGRQIWQRRGFDHVMIWTWTNPSTGERWYRLGVGRYTSRDDAQRAKDGLIRDGHLSTADWAPVSRIPEGAR